jgi:hypothetical protein
VDDPQDGGNLVQYTEVTRFRRIWTSISV